MQTLLVTGADGYTGALLSCQLRQHGFAVVAGVRNRARKLAHERQYGKAIVCDVSDQINVARAVASVDPDGIVHLAGCSHSDFAREQPLEAYHSIVSGWANLLDAVRRIVPRARVLLVSAGDVYGDAGSDGHPLTEDTPLHPTSTFGRLKMTAEWIARTYFEKYHLNLTIARPFHYTGPSQPETFFYGATSQRLAEWDANTSGGELALPDLACRRDVLHVQDVIDAYERLLHDGRPNEVYNVCSGQTRTCREIVEQMVQVARVPVRVVDSAGTDDSERIGVSCGDNTKLRTELGWQPAHTLDGAIQELVRSKQRTTTPQHT